MKQPHLVFVYNADAGLFSSFIDLMHKMVSPSTYNCRLCQLTYGSYAMKQQWKDFINNLPATKTFLHRDEFQKRYSGSDALPAVFYLRENMPVLLLPAAEIDACQTLTHLQNALLAKLSSLVV